MKNGVSDCLAIVARDGVDEDAIIHSIVAAAQAAVAAGELSKWAVPDQFRFVGEIAATSVGKVDKKRCAKSWMTPVSLTINPEIRICG